MMAASIPSARHRDSELDQIGRKHGTDKSSHNHDYLRFYERFLSDRRLEKLKILEIGVFSGASLKVWEEYFTNSDVVGADIMVEKLKYGTERTTIEIIDQSNVDDLVRLAVKHGPFDVIIEDGSHIWGHQILTLQTLFPYLRRGGIYIVEDLETNYGVHVASYRGNARVSCVEYLKQWLDLCVAEQFIDLAGIQDPFLRSYGRSASHLTFTKHCCLIEKRQHLNDTSFFYRNMLAPMGDDHGSLLHISAHAGNVGDILGDGCIVCDEADHAQNIQGFSVIATGADNALLTYRARLSDGTWTDYADPGQFTGTTGQGQDLTGFQFRFDPAFAAQYIIRLAGAFRGTPTLVETAADEPCVPSSGLGALYGMQISITRRGSGPLRQAAC